jgi:hypothetical protein
VDVALLQALHKRNGASVGVNLSSFDSRNQTCTQQDEHSFLTRIKKVSSNTGFNPRHVRDAALQLGNTGVQAQIRLKQHRDVIRKQINMMMKS